MQRTDLPGRTSLFVTAALTFIATVSLLAPPAARAAVPLRSADIPTAGVLLMTPCAHPGVGSRAPQLRLARTH